jgi:hypothetical protein
MPLAPPTAGSDFRLLVNDRTYQAAFPGMCLGSESDREIMTTKRGKRIATSIEGTLTGLGGNLIIIDGSAAGSLDFRRGEGRSAATQKPHELQLAKHLNYRPTRRLGRARGWCGNGVAGRTR